MKTTVEKFNMIRCTKWKCWDSEKNWAFDGTVVPRHCFLFPPYYIRGIRRAHKNCHVETITEGM
jgi:hypothetical protein